jgi:hypothetical protein
VTYWPLTLVQRAAWMNTTCNHALFAVVELYTQFLPALMPLLPQFYTVLVWSISQGMHAILVMVMGASHKACMLSWSWSWVLMSVSRGPRVTRV